MGFRRGWSPSHPAKKIFGWGSNIIHRSRQSWGLRHKGGLAWQEPRPTSYYREWSNDPIATGTDMCGAVLELMAYQGPLADHILDGFEEVIAKDPTFTAHFRRQYRKVKACISTPGWQPPFSSDPAGLPAPRDSSELGRMES